MIRTLALLLFVVGCATDPEPTSLEGDISCGSMTCGSGQICFSMESGSQCGVDPERGIGPYQEYGWTCMPLPDGCDVTSQCYEGDFTAVSDDGRYVIRGCI